MLPQSAIVVDDAVVDIDVSVNPVPAPQVALAGAARLETFSEKVILIVGEGDAEALRG